VTDLVSQRGRREDPTIHAVYLWETADSFLQRAESFHDCTMEDQERDIGAIREVPDK
jgi:hypothetical protein